MSLGTTGLSLPEVTRWGSNNRMLNSLIQNEAGLRLAVTYPKIPGNQLSRVSAAVKRLAGEAGERP